VRRRLAGRFGHGLVRSRSLFRGLGHDFPTHGVPAFEHGFDVFEVAGEGPGFVNIVRIAVGEHPAAVCAVFDGAEEEVDVWAWVGC
jgi:hypothetical protein